MNKIKILVFTNIDKDRRIEWPTELCCRPMVGDRIESMCGQHSRRIVGITHRWWRNDRGERDPILEIEVTQ